MTAPIMAATNWATNADLIADIAALGYIKADWTILDPTYGRGVWWKKWRPDHLVHNNRDQDGWDFRAIPYPDGRFDAVAFDPPYVCVGGRQTTTTPDFHARYGLTDAPRTPAALHEMNAAGLRECHRVVRQGGIVLVKSQDYVWSGRLWLGTHHTLHAALHIGFEVVDRLEHITRPRPQPDRGTPQQHARRNLSTMLVLRRRQPVEASLPLGGAA